MSSKIARRRENPGMKQVAEKGIMYLVTLIDQRRGTVSNGGGGL